MAKKQQIKKYPLVTDKRLLNAFLTSFLALSARTRTMLMKELPVCLNHILSKTFAVCGNKFITFLSCKAFFLSKAS